MERQPKRVNEYVHTRLVRQRILPLFFAAGVVTAGFGAYIEGKRIIEGRFGQHLPGVSAEVKEIVPGWFGEALAAGLIVPGVVLASLAAAESNRKKE